MKTLWLIGMMGSGRTAAGSEVARRAEDLPGGIVEDGIRPDLRDPAGRLEELVVRRTHACATAAHRGVTTAGKAPLADEVLGLWTGT